MLASQRSRPVRSIVRPATLASFSTSRLFAILVALCALASGIRADEQPRFRIEGGPILRIRLGVALSRDYVDKHCDGDEQRARSAVVEIVDEFNRWTVAELQLHLDLRQTVVPKSPAEDPTLGSNDKQVVLDSITKRFAKPSDFDLLLHICPASRIGGGLAYCPPGAGNVAFFVIGFGAADGWAVLRHEFAHTLDQWHEYGFPYQNGVMGGRGVPGNPFAAAPAGGGFYSRREVEGMTRCAKEVRMFPEVEASTGLVDARGAWKAPLPPKAMLDYARVKVGRDGAFEPVVVDVGKNDRSANGGLASVRPADGGASLRGGSVVATKSKGQLRYTPPSGIRPDASTFDHFLYVLEHQNGLADVGEVLVFYDLGDNLLDDGGFESVKAGKDGKVAAKGSRWRFVAARLAERPPRAYPRPWRGWYQSDLVDLVRQQDDARWVEVLPPTPSVDDQVVVLGQRLDARALRAGRVHRVSWETLEGVPEAMAAVLAWPGGERLEFRMRRLDLGDQGPSSVHDGVVTLPEELPQGVPELQILARFGPNARPFRLDNAYLQREWDWEDVGAQQDVPERR